MVVGENQNSKNKFEKNKLFYFLLKNNNKSL